MGNNTVAFFLNDYAGDVDRHADVVIDTIGEGLRGGCGASFRQVIKVLPSVHADGDQVIMAGGNRITPITVLRGCGHTEEDLLRALADRMGYSLRRKARRP